MCIFFPAQFLGSPEFVRVLLSVDKPQAPAQAVALLTGFPAKGLGEGTNQLWPKLLAGLASLWVVGVHCGKIWDMQVVK